MFPSGKLWPSSNMESSYSMSFQCCQVNMQDSPKTACLTLLGIWFCRNGQSQLFHQSPPFSFLREKDRKNQKEKKPQWQTTSYFHTQKGQSVLLAREGMWTVVTCKSIFHVLCTGCLTKLSSQTVPQFVQQSKFISIYFWKRLARFSWCLCPISFPLGPLSQHRQKTLGMRKKVYCNI